MGLYRVRTPVDYDVCPVLHHAERAAGVPDLLDAHDRGTMADRGTVVDDAPDLLRDVDAGALRLRGGAAPSKEDRPLGVAEHLRGIPDRFVKFDRCPRSPAPQYRGGEATSREELLRTHRAGVIDRCDDVPLHPGDQVIAEAPAEGADDIIDRGAIPHFSPGFRYPGACGAALFYEDIPPRTRQGIGQGQRSLHPLVVRSTGPVRICMQDGVGVRPAGEEDGSRDKILGWRHREYLFPRNGRYEE